MGPRSKKEIGDERSTLFTVLAMRLVLTRIDQEVVFVNRGTFVQSDVMGMLRLADTFTSSGMSSLGLLCQRTALK